MKGVLRLNEPMAKHVSWRAGGPAARAYIAQDLDDLVLFLNTVPPSEAVLFVGLGSNLLVRDGGFKGTVILMHAVLNTVRIEDERLYAEAGVESPKLARFAAKHGYAGAEFLAGIPGTIGGALAMNAGCYGSETWEKVDCVRTINRRGELQQRPVDNYEITYRHVVLRGESGKPAEEEWFVGAWFKLARGESAVSQGQIKSLLQKRIATQPLQQPNAGSVFRNPAQDHAARLIEACGLKGHVFGGAQVSEKHANFIVNLGNATAADIENLIHVVQDTVQKQQGILLEPEVRIVGDVASDSEGVR